MMQTSPALAALGSSGPSATKSFTIPYVAIRPNPVPSAAPINANTVVLRAFLIRCCSFPASANKAAAICQLSWRCVSIDGKPLKLEGVLA